MRKAMRIADAERGNVKEMRIDMTVTVKGIERGRERERGEQREREN